jgi:hypothetical protein
VRNGADTFARGVAENVLPLISHPIKSIGGILQRGGQAVADNPGSLTGALGDFAVKPLVEQGVNDYQTGGASKAILHGAGTGTGMWATGELGGAAMKPVASLASSALEAIGRGGLELGNSVLGARGPKPFKYGANPARGAYEEGILPALSRHSAAMKLEDAIPNVGQRISDKVMAGGNAPLADIARSIESPVNEARSVIEGPGGGNRSVEPIEALRSSMERRAPGANRPIYGSNAGTPFSPEEAHAAITRPVRLALPAPSEEIPLANSPDVEGRLSEPQGFLRRAPQYPESEQPSPLSNLTHPYATASDLWRTIQNLDKNTRFNPDPEVEGVNELRRDMRGDLRGNLEDAVPGLKPETQRYADLKLAEESLGRVLHGGMSLRKMMDLPMTAAESTVGYGMYEAGKMSPAAAAAAPVGRAGGLLQYLRNKDKEQQ